MVVFCFAGMEAGKEKHNGIARNWAHDGYICVCVICFFTCLGAMIYWYGLTFRFIHKGK